jgi:hypothetical protein
LGPFEAFRALAVHPVFGAFGTITAVLAIASIHPFAAVGPVATVEAIRAILAVAPVIAPAVALEGTVTIPVAGTLLLMTVFALWTVGPVVIAALAATFRHSGLVATLTGYHRLLPGRVEDVFAFCLSAEAGLRALLRVVASVETALALADLLAVSHDDAIVVLRMLEIVFHQNRITGRLGIPGERHVLLSNVSGRAAQLHIRTVALETPRQRVLAFALLIVLVIAAAASAVLLSLPHGLRSQPV